jgi:hypothetical protein
MKVSHGGLCADSYAVYVGVAWQGAGHFYFSTDFYHDLLQSGSFH